LTQIRWGCTIKIGYGMVYSLETESALKEAILYICQRCTIGSDRLNQVLFFADLIAYGVTLQSITGLEYQKLPNGPTPRGIEEFCAKMQDLETQELRGAAGEVVRRLVNLQRPNLNVFTAEQLSAIDQAIAIVFGTDAEAAKERERLMLGWSVMNEGETIPYGMVFLSNDPLTEIDIQRGREIAREQGCLIHETS
jgi:hypothetical protein